MRTCRITAALDIAITDTVPDGEGGPQTTVPLFRGYPGRRVRIARAALRAAGRSPAAAPLASFALQLCGEELVESMLACNPDRLDMRGLPWAAGLRRILEARLPHWFDGALADRSGEVRIPRTLDPSAKVSIVLPVYNPGRYLQQSIDSCLAQTYRNIELLIVDDGSADGVAAALRSYDDPRIQVLRHDTNRGIAAALNTGFAAASGEFFTWTSDDNFYDARAIEIMTGFLQTYRAVHFVYADMVIIDERDGTAPRRIQEVRPAAWFRARETNPVGACFLYRRQVHDTLGGYNTDAFLVEDYEYWLRIARHFRMQRIYDPLYYYRYHPETLTSRHARSEVVTRVREVRRRHNAWT